MRKRTEKEKQASSAAMAKQWADVRAMRVHLGAHVDEIVRKYVRIREAGLVEKVKAGDAAAVRDAKEILEGKSFPLFPGAPGIVAEPKEEFSGERKHSENVPGASGLKIMIWAIEKCGSIEQARTYFDKAVEALS